jgi:branched-subunit amino acid transport protein
MNVWLAVVGSSAAAVLLRVAFIAGNRWIRLPPLVDRASDVLTPAVTAALLTPLVFAPGGVPGIGPETVALALTAPVALRTKSVPLTLAIGMPLVWILRALW